ncbi:MAG: TIM44-like domain-containing protein, partial [Synergistaceae bacterium]|nr:TIM44-like domain-containing protein [Synergistaceae bacterium]
SSSSGSSHSSSSSGSSGLDSIFDFNNLPTNNRRHYRNSSTVGFVDDNNFFDDEEDESFDECMGVGFILLVFAVFWFFIKRQYKEKRRDPIIINTNEPVKILKPMSEYLDLDPEFDEEKIKTLMSNLYVQMQDTWHAKNISPLRPYMTDSFFNQMNRQLEQFRKQNQTDYTERIAVLNVGLKGWRQSAGMDYITVSLSSRIVSYVLDDLTGKLISGDKNREKFMEYEIELSRKSGVITQAETSGAKSATCPHCGAPLKLNASAQCEYCGSVITNVNTDWAICGMKGISQRTA